MAQHTAGDSKRSRAHSNSSWRQTAPLLAEISCSDLVDTADGSKAEISSFKHLASYNWLENAEPTISVPGSPALWSPPAEPPRLHADTGFHFIDQNAARSPGSGLEPLFHALFTERPTFDLGGVDLLTDRNNLRKLLRFVRESASLDESKEERGSLPATFQQGRSSGKKKHNDPFQIKVEIAPNGKTALFSRVEAKNAEFISGFQGYGHEYELAYTKPEITDSTGHHRIVQYNLGGLNCIVRFETDAQLRESGQTEAKPVAKSSAGTADSIVDWLSNLSLNKDKATKQPATSSGRKDGEKKAMTIERDECAAVPQAALLEIKTRVAHKEIDMASVMPQLWISQTPNLVVAKHQNGLFGSATPRDMTEAMAEWEKENQKHLQALQVLLRNIVDIVRRADSDGTKVAIVRYVGGKTLRIEKANSEKISLPKDLHAKCWSVPAQAPAA